MKLILTLIAIYALSAQAKTKFGGEITLQKPIKIDDAIKHFQSKDGPQHEILISGKVEKVCQKKGCWMAFNAKEQNVRITFKDYGFFVPASILGRNVLAQGELSRKKLSIKEARHYAKDAGKSKEEIRKINKPTFEYRFVASAVKILN